MQLNDYPKELGEYWGILSRRRMQFIVPFVLVLGGALALAFLLPPTYRSEATILINRQTIPENLVATTVTGYVQEQIQQTLQRITTNDNLLSIARAYDLYPQDIDENRQRVVREVRESIEVEMLDVEASNPDQSGTRVATIAFTVGFNAGDPETAQAVAADLSNRFLTVRRELRSSNASEVSQFLAAEAESIKDEIEQYENQLAGFKQEELRQLPELMGMNLQMYERTEQDIDATEERIRDLQERIDATRAEMSLTPAYEEVLDEEGNRILSASQRLSVLTAEYLQASSRYSAEHPDIMALSREIRVLAEQTGNAGRADELMNQLVRLQEQLRQARQQYADDHPEVTRLESAVSAVKRGFQSSLISPANPNDNQSAPPDNPRYVALMSQLNSSESNLAAEQAKLADLRDRLKQYEERLFQTPTVERDFKSISRGYEEALRKFSELKQKQLEAEMAQALESGSGAEQWQIVSAAYLPTMPESPNRIGILLLGGLLAFAAGVGYVAVAEQMDKTVRSVRIVTATLGVPPLAVIPRMRGSGPLRRRL